MSEMRRPPIPPPGPAPMQRQPDEKVIKLHTKMRRTRRARAVWMKVFLLLSVMAVTASAFMLNSELFRVKVIEISGANRVPSEEIYRQANVNLGRNLLLMSAGNVSEGLMANPLIKSVNIKRMIPSKIKIAIHERKPYAYALIGKRYYMIDDERVVIQIDKIASRKQLKVIRSDGAMPCDIGRRIDFPRQELAAAFFRNADETIEGQYREVRFNRDGITVILNNGAYVQLGDGNDMAEKLRLIPLLVKSLDRAKQDYIGINLKSLLAPTFVRKPSPEAAEVANNQDT